MKKPPNNFEYGIENHLYADESEIAGKGLFTSKKIKQGEAAFVMKGPKVIFHPRDKKEALELPNIVGIDEDTYMAPYTPYVFINHCCNPNVIADEDGVTYVALRDIEAGEELTFDYSTSEYSDWEMPCSCGAENCRRLVCSIDKLPKDFFEKYFPLIPKFFQRVFIRKYIDKDNKDDIN